MVREVQREFFSEITFRFFLSLSFSSDELRAPELTSAFWTAKMTSHYKQADDAMDYFTFDNRLSALPCSGSFQGHGQKVNKSSNSNSAEPEKVMNYERTRARPEKF